MNGLDNLQDGFYWAKTKKFEVWRMLRKSTDRQAWGMPWKDMEDGKRIAYHEITSRYSELVKVNQPVSTVI